MSAPFMTGVSGEPPVKLADPRVAAEDQLTGRVRGPVLLAQDDGYDAERTGFQTAARHQPAVIVGATGVADVRAAVKFAVAHELPVGVQGTGHSLFAVAASGGVLITTRRMTGVRVDAHKSTAWLGAGVRWEQVIHEAAGHGLAPLSGSAPGVGAVAYTLGGGLGLMARQYGYAADHVRSIDVVTADGCLRHVTADQEPDLFWALRGGRDNFGVVTAIEIELLPVTRLYAGGLFFSAELAVDALEAYRDWILTVPDELTSSLALIPFPDIPVIPEPIRGRHVAHVRIAYTGDAAAGERLIAPLRSIGPRLMDTLADLPYTASGSIYAEPTEPAAVYATDAMLSDLDSPATQTIVDLVGPQAPVPCVVEVRHLGGALARQPAVPNAVGHRGAHYLMNVLTRLDHADIDAVRACHQSLIEALSAWTTGRCLNFMDGENSSVEDVRSAYDRDDYQRLVKLKALYDPDNTFRLNHNIPPDVSGCAASTERSSADDDL